MPIAAVALALLAAAAPSTQARVEEAINKVKLIVNQPVQAYPREPGVRIWVYRPGWFHEGAIVPDFAAVDVRRTQEVLYAEHEWVSSNINPDLMWRGSDLEFNPMTKYFYTDRTVPKKRLTDAEMLEVNRLYRIIAESPPAPPAPPVSRPVPPRSPGAAAPTASDSPLIPPATLASAAAVLLLLVALWLVRRRRAAGGR